MSSSGLIYAAIALVWAAVLIPMWLRNHDSTTDRSAERFGQAMRVLSGRASSSPEPAFAEAGAGQHEVPASPRSTAASSQPGRAEAPARSRSPQQARRTLARRRARTLAVLGASSMLLALLAVAGVVPIWAPLPVVVLLAAFVVNLRLQAKRAEDIRRRRATADPVPDRAPSAADVTSATGRPHARGDAEFVPGPSRAVVVETKRRGGSDPVDVEEAPVEPAAAMDDDEAWRPNPLPLPTYVTAPKAMRPIKVIDLTTPGAWTSGRLLDDDAMADEDFLAAELAADELDAVLEQEAAPVDDGDPTRRAVGD